MSTALVPRLAEEPQGQGRRDDAEEADDLHDDAPAPGVLRAELAAGEDELRQQEPHHSQRGVRTADTGRGADARLLCTLLDLSACVVVDLTSSVNGGACFSLGFGLAVACGDGF